MAFPQPLGVVGNVEKRGWVSRNTGGGLAPCIPEAAAFDSSRCSVGRCIGCNCVRMRHRWTGA